MIDPILEATLYKPIRGLSPEAPIRSADHNRENSNHEINNLHDFLGLKGMVSVRRSFVTTIDLGMKLPNWLTRTIGNPGTAIGLGLGVSILILLGLFVFISRVIGEGAGLAIAMPIAAALGWLVFRFLTGTGSFFEVVHRLHYWPHSIIQMDSASVTIQGGWSKVITPNARELAFSTVVSGPSKGLRLIGSGEKEIATVFMYHELFKHLIMTDDELEALKDRLNAILESVRTTGPENGLG
jgi:hypothetical protein